MKAIEATSILDSWSKAGISLFTASDLGKIFDESGPTLRSTIGRLVQQGSLSRVARNLYLFSFAPEDAYLLERIAVALRRGDYVFESLESAASKWGIVSQVPVDRITVMTTGRSGEFHTPFGTIEFVHTRASPEDILSNTVDRPGNPLPIASKRYTVDNMRNCRRSMHLIDWEEVEHG